jgi:hypothetical protein
MSLVLLTALVDLLRAAGRLDPVNGCAAILSWGWPKTAISTRTAAETLKPPDGACSFKSLREQA